MRLAKLTLSGFKSFADTTELLASLPKLYNLDAKGTKLRVLPDEVAKLPLRDLCLDDNPELDFEQALSVAARIPTLRKLSLMRCGLTKVPPALCTLTQLDRLYLNDNAITELPAALAAIELDVLGAMNNAIDHIPDELEPSIQSLYFGGNPGARAEKKRLDAVRKGFVMLG